MATTISVQEHPASLHLNASAEHDEATNSAQISTSANALTSLQDGSAANFERLSLGVLFLTMLIFLGGTFFMTHKRHIPLPYTVVLFLYGIVVGVISLWIYPDVADAFGSIPPNLLFYIFLPVLIFEGSYAINIHALRRVMWQTVLLATVGVVINTIILGSVIKLLFLSWSWYSALLLGTLLSATDPVSVVALLKNLKVENALTAMVEGESVLNDGTAIIAFTLLLPAAHAGELTMSGWGILGESFRLSLLPLILGPIFGLVQLFWLRKAYDGLTRACITVSVTYVSYYVAAELIGTSGVLTLFIQGIFLSNACPSLFPGREGNQIYATWEFLVHLGNTVLFSMVGVILVADVIPTLRLIDIVLIVVVYLTMLAARWMMLEALLPLMNQFAYKMNQRKVLLMVHAGLRGGVATTLALAVKSDGLNEGITMLKITAGVVLLSLVLNGSTAAYVVGLCGFRCKPQHRVLQMGFAMDFLVNAEERTLDRMKRDTKYRNASWLSVEKYVDKHLRNPFRGMHITKESDEVVVNRLLMSAFKASLWRQRDEGVISETVVHSLGRVLAKVIDRGELLDVREMELYHKHRAKTANSSARSLPQTPNHAQDEVATTNGTKHSFDSPDKNKGAVAVAVRGVASSTSDDDDEREMTSRAQELSLNVVPGSPSEVGRDEASSDLVIDSLMRRLLPRWVVLLEHVFGHGYFEAQHRRAQENAFMTLLALAKCLSDIGPIKYKYTQNEAQARRVEEWMGKQVASSTAAIRFFYSNFPEATNNVSSSRAVLSVANHLLGSLKTLRTTHGFNAKISDMLNEMIADMRDEIPMRWDHDVSKKESDLVRRAVAATTLGKGLRRSEIQAISSMGLVKKFRENDTIKLPENAFLVVVFGSLRALHGSWTTVNEHELMESYGDTVGLESFLLPKELRKDQQREWRVVSTEATALLISFNSISPFLSERSLRSVKALWRAAAVEVILPILADMITLPPNEEVNTREHFIRVVMNGTPLIGPQDCRNFDWRSSQLHLCFYLRGCDKMGMFNGHTPPCYISTFYAHQLEWEDHEVVLYAVPVNVSDHGYIPWVEEPPRQLDTPVEPAHGSLDIHREDSYGTNLDTQPSSNCLEEELDVAQSRTPERAAKPSFPSLHVDIPASPSVHPLEMDLIRTHAAATTILNSVLQGSIPLHPLRRHEIRSSPSMWEADDPQSPVIVSPTPSFSTRLTFSAQVVCILQNVEAFVTPVPFVNQLLAQYAAVLEQLCVAAVRYVREPNDPVNLRHAQRIAETALEFLLGFSVQLALVKRAIGCLLLRYPAINREASFSSPDIRAGVVIEEEDSVFQCKVCAWMRLASLTRKYHLKTITTEMNSFANCRFGGLAQTLKRIVVMEPGLKRVESVEGMYALIKRATDAHEEAPDPSSMSPI